MDFNAWLLNADSARAPLEISLIFFTLGLAFLGGQIFAWVFLFTRRGVNASRSLVNSIVVMPVLVALMMMVLQDNLVSAFGMMSIFAIVRFRNVLSEAHDTTYVFAAIMLGVAAGTQRFTLAVIGCAVVSAILLYLAAVRFDDRVTHDLVLHVSWQKPADDLGALNQLLSRHGKNSECTSVRTRESGGADLAYLLLLRNPGGIDQLLSELEQLEGVAKASIFKADREKKT
jgi:hypothetical protein